MRIGFLGLGAMGLPMARNLARAGHEVVAWNRTPSRGDPLLAVGGRSAASPAEVAGQVDLLLSMLADDAAVQAVVLDAGTVAALPPGAAHACMSTISVALSKRLAQAHHLAGKGYVAAPVFGRPQAAEAAKLTIVAAGDPDARARFRPLFDALGQAVFELGEEASAANVVKLCGNFLIGAMLEAVSEAYALARKCEIEPAQLLQILNGGLVRSPLYESYGTLMAEERFEPAAFKLRLGLKDMRLVLAAADSADVPMPLASLVHDHLLSGEARGWGEKDWAALSRVVSEAAGL